VTGITYLFMQLIALILPGWIIVRLAGFDRGRMVLMFASGYMYYVLLAAISKWLNLPLSTFFSLYLGLFTLLALLSLKFHAKGPRAEVHHYWWWGLVCVIIAYTLYRFLVGPYTEIPSDLYRHLEFVRLQYDAIAEGTLGKQLSARMLLKQQGGVWYSFYALASYYSGLQLDQSLSWATYANSLIFLCTIYGFSWYIFGQLRLAKSQQLAAALLAVFFVASQFGINVFAYIRYYALAPTMLNMVIYLAAVIAMLELLSWRDSRISYTIFVLVALLASMLVHTQEALFILLSGGLMLAWFALCPESLKLPGQTAFLVKTRRYYVLALLIALLGFMLMVIWTYMNLERPLEFFGKITQLSQQGPILNRILYLTPGYQMIQVITVWGLVVYALFAIFWRKFVVHPLLFTGMFVPLVSIFNPLFVDWFLRIEGVHTLWRMLYMVPTHFIAALAVVFMYQRSRSASGAMVKVRSYVGIALLFALLLPLGGLNPNSRQTLAATDRDESYTYWQDLIDYLNQPQLGKANVLTDPITGYVVNALTPHRSNQYKFYNKNMLPFNLADYSDAPLRRYRGWLVVMNARGGGYSETGERARHWPANALDTSAFYTDALAERIRENPQQRFELLWEQNKIRVYRIR